MALGRTLRFFGKYYRISQLTRNELAGFCVIGSAVQQELQQICQAGVNPECTGYKRHPTGSCSH